MDERLRIEIDLVGLTRGLVAGDEEAYRVFYDAYVDRLSRYLLVVTRGNEDEMREALQGTLVRVVRAIRVFSDENIFWSWLTVLARSASSDDRRKRGRYRAFLDRFFREAPPEETSPTGTDDSHQLNLLLVSALARLEEEERQLVEGKYFKNQSVRELAQARGASEKAIESKLTRLRVKLKQAIIEQLRHEKSRP